MLLCDCPTKVGDKDLCAIPFSKEFCPYAEILKDVYCGDSCSTDGIDGTSVASGAQLSMVMDAAFAPALPAYIEALAFPPTVPWLSIAVDVVFATGITACGNALGVATIPWPWISRKQFAGDDEQ